MKTKKLDTQEIVYCDIPFTVTGIFHAAEAPDYYNSDGSGYPGCPASFDLDEILINGVNVYEILTNSQIDEITDLVIEKFEENE
jgi:hypothetical protein